jgi:hypothetical protein
MVTIRNVLFGDVITFKGLFGCSQASISCSAAAGSCYNAATTCPTAAAGIAALFKGSCPGSGRGLQAGWTFGLPDTVRNGGELAAGALAVPEQLFKAGIITKRVVSCVATCLTNNDVTLWLRFKWRFRQVTGGDARA